MLDLGAKGTHLLLLRAKLLLSRCVRRAWLAGREGLASSTGTDPYM